MKCPLMVIVIFDGAIVIKLNFKIQSQEQKITVFDFHLNEIV